MSEQRSKSSQAKASSEAKQARTLWFRAEFGDMAAVGGKHTHTFLLRQVCTSEHLLLNGSPGSSTLGDKNTEQHSANRRE